MGHGHLSTEEAKIKQLPGWDVFRYSHVLYLSDLQRDWGVVALNREAYKAFSDTILIKHRADLAAEQEAIKEWLNQGGFNSNLPLPWGAAGLSQLEYMNYEYLKVACGFELHLKARLLSQEYVLHEINDSDVKYRTLAKEQQKRPINKAELFSIDGFRFNGKENYLPGLKPTSIKFSLLTDKAEYLKAIGLPDETMALISDYRNLRNQIHLPGDAVETPGLQKLKGKHISEFILDFVNEEIVDCSNKIIVSRKFMFPLLAIIAN